MRNDKPFSVYGDSVCLFVQNIMIMALIWKFDDGISMIEKVIFFVFTLSYLLILFLGQFYNDVAW